MGRPSPWKGSGRQQSDGGRGDPGGPVGPTGPVTAVTTAEGPGGQGLELFQSEPLLPAAKRLGLLSQFGSLFLLFPGGVPLATQPQASAASEAGPREGRCGPRLPGSRTQPDLTATLSRGNRLSHGSGDSTQAGRPTCRAPEGSGRTLLVIAGLWGSWHHSEGEAPCFGVYSQPVNRKRKCAHS